MKDDPLHQMKRCREDLYNYLSSMVAFLDISRIISANRQVQTITHKKDNFISCNTIFKKVI